MKKMNVILTISCLLTSCYKPEDKMGEGSKEKKTLRIIERNPCKADEACQKNYDNLLVDAYQKITVDSLRTTESLNQAKQNLEKAKFNECGDCLDIQKAKWDNIYSKSVEGYKSSESIVKDYNDSDHKLRMERYKALMAISKNAIQK